MPNTNSMLYWLAHVCRSARMQAKPKLKHLDIASRVRDHLPKGESVDNSTISRFERGTTWPRTPMDAIVAAYADELRCQPIELWQEALRLWHANLAGETLSAEAVVEEAKPRRAGGAAPVKAGRARRRAG